MKHISVPLGIALLVVLAPITRQVKADYLNWSYTATSNVPGISVDAQAPTGGASVTLTDYRIAQPGATTIPVQAYVTTAGTTSPIVFGPSSNVPTTYNLALTIRDGTTHDSGTLNFTGYLAGSLTATTSSLVNTLAPVTSNSLTLDGHKYTVSIPPMTLAAPNSPQQNILAKVSVTDASKVGPGVTPNTNGVPEPTSIVLAGFGLSLLVGDCCRGFQRREKWNS